MPTVCQVLRTFRILTHYSIHLPMRKKAHLGCRIYYLIGKWWQMTKPDSKAKLLTICLSLVPSLMNSAISGLTCSYFHLILTITPFSALQPCRVVCMPLAMVAGPKTSHLITTFSWKIHFLIWSYRFDSTMKKSWKIHQILVSFYSEYLVTRQRYD